MFNGFRRRLASGERLVGTMVTLPCPSVAEILVAAGFDWLFLDAEHGPLEVPDLMGILQAVGERAPSLVRVPELSEGHIKKVLDIGAAGVIVPQVNSAEQAARVVQYARYAPQGSRGVGLARAHGYGFDFESYIQQANDKVTVVVQAEHRDAVDNIESIVAVPGVDCILLGPYDLAASMGKMGQVDDPAVTAAIGKVTAACKQANLPLGMFGVKAEAIQPTSTKTTRYLSDPLTLSFSAQRPVGCVNRWGQELRSGQVSGHPNKAV